MRSADGEGASAIARSNIVLIGMPGAGKSTVGVILAKQLARNFLDTDLLIQVEEGQSLQQIVDREGYLSLRRIEERVLLGLACRDHVIATGGSAVYGESAMEHLRALGAIVFLDVDLPTLVGRIRDFGTRGVARRPEQTLADLFEERSALYRRFAETVIDCRGLTQELVCAAIRDRLGL